MKKYDVIVIGAGNGGLSAGAYASKEGLKTVVFEKHNLPGGSASSFRRGRFEFEPSLDEMAQVGSEKNPGATRKVFDILGTDFKFHHENTTYRVISTDPNEKYDVRLPCGIENFCKKVDEEVPGSYESVKRFFDYQEKSMRIVNNLPHIKFKDIPDVMTLLRMVSYSTEKVMDLLKIPKKAQHIISTYWPYVGESTDTMCAFMMGMMDYIYVVDGAGMPKKTSHEISMSIEKVIRQNGGDIFYNCPVTKILVKDGQAYGVLAGGKEYYANNIICNCYPNDIYGKMIDKKEVPEIEVKKVNARQIALSFVTVYLGLNKNAEELGVKDYTVFLQQSASPKEQFEQSHCLGGKGWVIVNNMNVTLPDFSPKGTCVMSITTSVYGDDWAKVKAQDYRKTKYKIAEEMIDYYEKTTGIKIKPYIEEIEVASPVTFSRYIGSPNGTPYGYQTSNWDGVFVRTVFKHFEKPIKGLHYVGAYTEGSLGYNQTYKSGINAIEEIKKEAQKDE